MIKLHMKPQKTMNLKIKMMMQKYGKWKMKFHPMKMMMQKYGNQTKEFLQKIMLKYGKMTLIILMKKNIIP